MRPVAMIYFRNGNGDKAKAMANKVREDDADCYLVAGELFREDLTKNCQAVFIDAGLDNYEAIKQAYMAFGADGVKIHTAFEEPKAPEPKTPEPEAAPQKKRRRKPRASSNAV